MIGRLVPVHGLHQGAFTGPAAADQCDKFSRLDGQVDVVQDHPLLRYFPTQLDGIDPVPQAHGLGQTLVLGVIGQLKWTDLDLIAWTAERSGRMREDVLQQNGAFYYATVVDAIGDDGAVMEILHALANQVGVRGVFSDWPGTVTYYANCLGY